MQSSKLSQRFKNISKNIETQKELRKIDVIQQKEKEAPIVVKNLDLKEKLLENVK